MSDQPTIPFSYRSTDISLRDLLVSLKYETMEAMNCHAIGTIQDYSQGEDFFTVQVTINYDKTRFVADTKNKGSYVPTQQPYPLLVDCPAIVMGGGNTALQFPVTKGDQCLILFNDVDLSNWFAGARSGPVATNASHSFSDAIALVGFKSVGEFDPDHALLTNGHAKIGVEASASGTHVTIANDLYTLKVILDDIVSALNTYASAIGPVSSPVPVTNAQAFAAAAALAASFALVSTKIANLLE